MENYVVYHLHSDLSNGVTNVDSVTKFDQYVKRAQECGMTALGFSEHGSIFEWWHKKCAIEQAGMKYIHGIEAYLTESLEEKVRDNYHCVLIAKNYDGFLELNSLISGSFNRKDNHFYYVPRISFGELFATSENIIVTTACIGGVYGKGTVAAQSKMTHFLETHSDRCFLEIGHHLDPKQVEYNKKMVDLSQKTGVRLIAGTDTHVLDERHERGRSILQIAKNIHFDDEAQWDLKFKDLGSLLAAFKAQAAIDPTCYLEAINNTNILADMIEPIVIDQGTKYPHIYQNPEETFKQKIADAIESHPYALRNHTREELEGRVAEELEVYKATKSIDFMLLQSYLREWEREHGIQCGYGRGSVSGSMIAYLLGITQMDSMRFDLNFFRFLNPSRVTNADIDTDYAGPDRDAVKQFLLRDKMNLENIRSAEIITFNTIATKGAVRDVCRALYKDRTDINYLKLSADINREFEEDEASARERYKEVFEYVDIVSGTIVSVGTHPSGVLISDLPIEQTIGLCSVSTSDYPVSMINMKELDDLFYVKLDILGLDNLGVINETCKTLGIERLTPDNVDLDDENAWKSIRDDTTLIFQWESNSAQAYIRKFMSDKTLAIAKSRVPDFSMLKWLSFGNGLIRPACASFRDQVANGEFYDNGFDALNEMLAKEAGRIAMQETIMRFLVKFCGYSAAESDTVRRGIAKKKGTEELLPEIERRFIEYCTQNYGLTPEKCEEIIKPFLQVILDASAYAFSWNHSDPYSATGYICGYLRYYYPLEFLTAALNIFGDDFDKTNEIINYASKVGIVVTPPKWGLSMGNYFFNKERRVIAKGLTSIKYMSKNTAPVLYDLAQRKKYDYFVDVLTDIDRETRVDSRQLDILIKIDYFSDFGNQRELLRIAELYSDLFKRGEAKKLSRERIDGTPLESIVKKYSTGVTKSGGVAKSYTILDIASVMRETEDAIKAVGMEDLDVITKARNFKDAMGYVGFISYNEADRRKLYVTSTRALKNRTTGKVFGHEVITKSIGSGIQGHFTVFNEMFNLCPIKEDDVIFCTSWEKDRRYKDQFRLNGYHKIS